MAGALEFLNDPANQGLIGLASGLLQAGGPQRFPTSFGQALGQGAMQGNQMQMQAQQFNLARKVQQQQLQALEIQNILAGNKAAFFQGLNNPQSQGAPQSGQPSIPQSVPTSDLPGIAAGQINAGQPIPQSPQPQSNGLPNVPGLNPMLSRAAAMGWLAPGYVSAVSQAPSALMGKGYVPGPNGGWVMDPGYAKGQGIVAGSEADAKLPADLVSSAVRYAGRPVVLGPTQRVASSFDVLPTYLQDALKTAATGLSAPGQPGAAPASNGNGFGGIPPTLTPLQESSQKDRAAKLEDYGASLNINAQSAIKDNSIIDNMRAEMGGFTPGKFTGAQNEIGSYLVRAPWFNKMFPNVKDSVAAWQEFEKNSTMLSSSAARAMGAREPGSVIAMFKNAYPNASLTDQTLGAMFAQIHGMNDYHIATQRASDSWRNSPQNMEKGTLSGFQSNWNKSIDPMIFIYREMPSEVRQQYAQSLSPNQRKAFAEKISAALSSGILPPSGQ